MLIIISKMVRSCSHHIQVFVSFMYDVSKVQIEITGTVYYQLVRQSQIVQSVVQDCQYVLSHLLPECNLLVQGPKITYNYCLSRRF